MPKAATATRPGFRCVECGWTTHRWVGRCAECQAWGSIETGTRTRGLTAAASDLSTPALPIGLVDARAAVARPSGLAEFDRVLGGGLVPGAVVLLAGEPGAGKSTLLLEVAARWAGSGARTLYVTGEESAAQVRLRAGRTRSLADLLFLAAETDLGGVLAHVDQVQPSLLVLDSIQTIASADVDGTPGGITQVREVAAALSRVAKTRGMSVILVGHVTKDGSVAGPRMLEHLVDVVLSFEGNRPEGLRMVRAVKNRFGPSDEVGCFDLGESGIVSVADPSGLFVSRHLEPVPGTCLTVTIEGRRPLVAEVQALVASGQGSPRRASPGLDAGRVSLLLAVLERRIGMSLSSREVYTATVGGARVSEPAADLAIALAVASAAADHALPAGMIAIGEVGLAGEVRPVGNMPRRLAEAARLGFSHVLVPADAEAGPPPPVGVRISSVHDLVGALAACREPVSGRG